LGAEDFSLPAIPPADEIKSLSFVRVQPPSRESPKRLTNGDSPAVAHLTDGELLFKTGIQIEPSAGVFMATERQIAANRRNAKRSTGPRTEAGKAVSRLNCLKHGMTAMTVLLQDEDPEEYDRFQEALVDELRPQGVLEQHLAQRLAATLWRHARAEGYEAALLAWNRRGARDQHAPGELGAQEEVGRAIELTLGIDGLAKLGRHEGHLMRQVEALTSQLRDLQKQRLEARSAGTRAVPATTVDKLPATVPPGLEMPDHPAPQPAPLPVATGPRPSGPSAGQGTTGEIRRVISAPTPPPCEERSPGANSSVPLFSFKVSASALLKAWEYMSVLAEPQQGKVIGSALSPPSARLNGE
jgi:hypothetical protein